MLMQDPLAQYLNEGGLITPGFRLRNPVAQVEPVVTPEEPVTVPNVPRTEPPPVPDVPQDYEGVPEGIPERGPGSSTYSDTMPQMQGENVAAIVSDNFNPYNVYGIPDDPISFGNTFTSLGDIK